ncbi:transposase [Serinicoccus sediminis]|uniref:transposase n=1 Tax=Serinicoccus sediminis TaxID=2306021 RepID=UPI001EDDEEED|nr:transposase [Serinicoccus sediminis]
MPEIARLGRTLRKWKDAFLAYFTNGATNGGTERSTDSSNSTAASPEASGTGPTTGSACSSSAEDSTYDPHRNWEDSVRGSSPQAPAPA